MEEVEQPKKGSWNYKDWYAKNREALSQKRKALYAVDPKYRQAVMDRSAQRRKAMLPPTKEGLSVTEVSESLGVTLWTLNRWKGQNYIPVDSLRGYRFSPSQVELLALFKAFFIQYPKRSSASKQDELQSLINVVAHNWNL